jgi:lipopolysaccharide export LptBFGC system permease protein LptF
MAKTVIKEIIIMLLLCLTIILLLGILLYEYVPIAKTIPNSVSYTTPESVKEELAATADVDEDEIIMTYEIDSDDLNNYKKIQDYKPGKANPFSSYETKTEDNTTSTNSSTSETGNTTTTTESNSQTSNSTSSQTNSTENTTTSGGQFFQDKGTK